jgi:excisionase family DNA binding protein
MEHLITSEDVAEILHVEPITIRRMVNRGLLPAYRIGTDYRFAPSELQDYLQQQRINNHTPHNQSALETNASAYQPLNQLTQLLRNALHVQHTMPADLTIQFDCFTQQANRVVTLAQAEAVRLQHNYIGTEHLLLALIGDGENTAAQVLNSLESKTDQIRHEIDIIIGRGDNPVTGEIGFTPNTKKAIKFAADEATLLNHRIIGTEHLLLGLMRQNDGIASHVLKSLGFHLDLLRSQTLHVLHQHQQEMATQLAKKEQELICPSCGTDCPHHFHYCFNCGQPLSNEKPVHDKSL